MYVGARRENRSDILILPPHPPPITTTIATSNNRNQLLSYSLSSPILSRILLPTTPSQILLPTTPSQHVCPRRRRTQAFYHRRVSIASHCCFVCRCPRHRRNQPHPIIALLLIQETCSYKVGEKKSVAEYANLGLSVISFEPQNKPSFVLNPLLQKLSTECHSPSAEPTADAIPVGIQMLKMNPSLAGSSLSVLGLLRLVDPSENLVTIARYNLPFPHAHLRSSMCLHRTCRYLLVWAMCFLLALLLIVALYIGRHPRARSLNRGTPGCHSQPWRARSC